MGNLDTYEFSVAMSVYKNDNPVFFERALQSITEEQIVKPTEIVLVVDGPITKELDMVIDKYSVLFSKLNVIRLEKNEGLGNALRVAVENSKYNLIARMDSDDVSMPERFQQQLQYLESHKECDVVGGDISEFIGEEENIVGKRCVPTKNEEILRYMKKRCAMNHVSVMYKKESVQKAGGYQDWFWNEDYYLWIRMWRNGAVFGNLGAVLVNVRVGEEMYQRRGGKKYFQSETQLQKYMLKAGLISYPRYLLNCFYRCIVQIFLPNKMREIIYLTFARN